MEKTYVTKAGDIQREWYVVDAEGQNLGRLAARIAALLRGKHKPMFTPGLDTGDFVIVVNAGKITVTGKKMDEKIYYRHSNYPGGLKRISLRDQLSKHPTRVIEAAVRGMLPKNRLGRAMIKKLKVYATADHQHAAQQPKPLA
ncbi:MAG: 50S ribosomal protein L13 [Chloroflexi bacterium]|nr:50S ribosomal protein L13 [Chloroflexota bacterium]